MKAYYEDDDTIIPFQSIHHLQKGRILFHFGKPYHISVEEGRWEEFLTDYFAWLKETSTLGQTSFVSPEESVVPDEEMDSIQANLRKAIGERDGALASVRQLTDEVNDLVKQKQLMQDRHNEEVQALEIEIENLKSEIAARGLPRMM